MRLKRYVEPAKTVLIVLLTLSAALLLWQSGVFRQFREALTAESASAGAGESGVSENTASAALPLALSVNLTDGSHYGVKYDAQALETVFDRFSGALSEALGSSQTPVAATAHGWESALTSPGLFLDFYWPVPLDCLAQWLGTEILTGAGDRQVTRLCLAVEGETVVLWFPAEESFWRCQTALEPGDLLTLVGSFAANGAAFAWELDDATAGDRFALVLERLPILYETAASAVSAVQISPETLLDAFGVNRFVATAYQEQDTRVFVEGGTSLRLDAAGEVTFRGEDGAEDPAGSRSEAVSAAWTAVSGAVSGHCGQARLQLSGAEQTETGWRVTFDYVVQGLPVQLSQGDHAATVTVRDGTVTAATVYLRSYRLTETPAELLPERQAQAIAEGLAGARLRLICLDGPEETAILWTAED